MKNLRFSYFLFMIPLLVCSSIQAAEHQPIGENIANSLVHLTWSGRVNDNLQKYLGCQEQNQQLHQKALELAIDTWQEKVDQHANNQADDYKSLRKYYNYLILAISQYFYSNYKDVTKNTTLEYNLKNGSGGYYQHLLSKTIVARDQLIYQIWEHNTKLSENQQSYIQQYKLSSALANIILGSLAEIQGNSSTIFFHTAWRSLSNSKMEISARYILQADLLNKHKFNPSKWNKSEILDEVHKLYARALKTKIQKDKFPTFFQIGGNPRVKENIEKISKEIKAKRQRLAHIQNAYKFVDEYKNITTRSKNITTRSDVENKKSLAHFQEIADFLSKEMKNHPIKTRNRLDNPWFNHARYYLWTIVALNNFGYLEPKSLHFTNFIYVYTQLDMSLKNLKENFNQYYAHKELIDYWLPLLGAGKIFANNELASILGQDVIIGHLNTALFYYEKLSFINNISKSTGYWVLTIVNFASNNNWCKNRLEIPKELATAELVKIYLKKLYAPQQKKHEYVKSKKTRYVKGENTRKVRRHLPVSEMANSSSNRQRQKIWKSRVAENQENKQELPTNEFVRLTPPPEYVQLTPPPPTMPVNNNFMPPAAPVATYPGLNPNNNFNNLVPPLTDFMDVGEVVEDPQPIDNAESSEFLIIEEKINQNTGLIIYLATDKVESEYDGWKDYRKETLSQLYDVLMMDNIEFIKIAATNEVIYLPPQINNPNWKKVMVIQALAQLFDTSREVIGLILE